MNHKQVPLENDTSLTAGQTPPRPDGPQACVWEWDLLTNRVVCSERFGQLIGCQHTGPESTTHQWHNYLHPDDRERVAHHLRQALEQGETEWADQYRLRRADGFYIQVHNQALIIFSDGKAVRMIGSLISLPELVPQPLEQAGHHRMVAFESAEISRFGEKVVGLTESKGQSETFRLVQKHLPDALTTARVGVVIARPDGRFAEVNEAVGHLTGYSPGELARGGYELILPPDELLRYQQQLDELISSQISSVTIQLRGRHKAGHSVWFSFHTTLMPADAGLPGHLFSIIQDISRDMATRDEQQKMLTLVENSLNFMAIANLDGSLAYINKAGRELVGMTEDDIKAGRIVADFYSPEQYTFIVEVAIPALLSQGYWSGRVQFKHFKTGEIIPCYANGIRIDDPQTGQPIGRGFSIRDLRPELAAQEAQRKLLTLVDNSIELMSILEMDGKNSYINKAGMAMLGFDNEQQVLETPISQLHAPEHFSLVEQQVLPSVMNLGRWSGEMLVRHLKTGEIFPVYNNTIRIDDPDTGQPIAVGAVMRDMRPELAAKQAFINSEARFRNMVMQAPVAICLFQGEDLIIESANESALVLIGKSADITGKPLRVVLPELEGQGFIDLMLDVYRSGIPHHSYGTRALIMRHGRLEEGYYNSVYAPIWENKDTIRGLMAVSIDVTAQIQAQKDLEESEKRFKNLILDAPIATAVYNCPDMTIQLANEVMLKTWGKDKSVIGKRLSDALPELEEQPFLQLLNKVYTTGIAYQAAEERADLVVDGKLQTFYFNFTYKPLHDANGEVYAILNMAVDVTSQVKARHQLKETEESLREAVDLAELAPWTTTVATSEMTCSERVYDWLGITGTITPEIVTHCIHEQDRPLVDAVVTAAMNPVSGGKMDLEYRVVNQQTSQERILRTQARVLFTEQGMPYLIRGTSQDITAQRMTEQALEKQVKLRTEELIKSNIQLKRSNQELERYAYIASHDLQEPLRKIQLYSSLIRERHFQHISDDEGLGYFLKVEKAAGRMSMLIKNILDFSRINQVQEFVDYVDLNEIIRAVVSGFALQLDQKQARIEVGTLGTVRAVPLQMTQLFQNLIDNSLKFSRPDVPPRITISSRPLTEQELVIYEKLNPQTAYCLITIADNGIGFNPAFGEKIFSLFQRLHPQQHYEGTGLGLSLCQRIIFNHQGDIWATSEPGKGATFYVALPVSQPS